MVLVANPSSARTALPTEPSRAMVGTVSATYRRLPDQVFLTFLRCRRKLYVRHCLAPSATDERLLARAAAHSATRESRRR